MSKQDRFYLRLLIAVTIGLVAISISRLLPPRMVGGADFAVFRAAAQAVLHARNPYIPAVLRAAMTATHAPSIFVGPATFFVSPLWVGLVFSWSVFLPFNAAYAVWSVVSIGLVAFSFAALAKWASWPSRFGVTALGTASFSAFIGYTVGQVDALLLLCLVWAIVWATRRHWLLSGAAAMVAVCLKPQVVWPVVPFLLIVAWPQREALRRALVGQGLALVALAGIPMLIQPGWVLEWLHGLSLFSRTLPSEQPDPAQLAGLLRLVPGFGHTSLGFGDPMTWFLVVVSVGAMGFWARWLLRSASSDVLSWRDRIGWGLGMPLVLWSLASPYLHSDDLLAVAPAVVLLLAPGWWGVTGRRSWLLCLALAILPDSYELITGRFGGPWVLTSVATLWLAVAAGIAVHNRITTSRASGVGEAATAP